MSVMFYSYITKKMEDTGQNTRSKQLGFILN